MNFGLSPFNGGRQQITIGGGGSTAAGNGVSYDLAANEFVLGNNAGDSAAQLTSGRQIPLNGNYINFTDTNTAVTIISGEIDLIDNSNNYQVILTTQGNPQILLNSTGTSPIIHLNYSSNPANNWTIQNSSGILSFISNTGGIPKQILSISNDKIFTNGQNTIIAQLNIKTPAGGYGVFLNNVNDGDPTLIIHNSAATLNQHIFYGDGNANISVNGGTVGIGNFRPTGYKLGISGISGFPNGAALKGVTDTDIALTIYNSNAIIAFHNFYSNGKIILGQSGTQNIIIGTTIDDGINKLQVNSTVKAISFISTSLIAPANSADVQGQTGELRIVSGFIYAKDAVGWKRIAIATF